MSTGDYPMASAQEHAYRRLRQEILNGGLPAGARLKQQQLAKRFKISRMPVRDALHRLHAEGLVSIEPNRGVIVTQLAPAEVVELFEIRSVLEGLALQLAMQNFTDQAREEIEDLLHRLERAVPDLEVWIKRHDEFHEYLNQWSNRPRLQADIRQLRSAVQPYFRMFLMARGHPEAGVTEHRALVDTIKRGDVKNAQEEMRRHVMSAAAGMVEFLTSRAKARAEAEGNDDEK